MTALLLAVLACGPARAETAGQAVRRVMSRVEEGIASAQGKDAREIASSDKRTAALGRELAKFSREAAPPLAAYAGDLQHPAKARLFATVYLGLLGDPAIHGPLTEILLDSRQDPEVRSVAAQNLGTLELPRDAVRRSLCSALALPELPPRLVDDVLAPLTRLGCADPEPLEKAARAHGPRPDGRDLETVRRAAAALGRSRGAAPARALLGLLAYFPPRGAARRAVVSALLLKSKELTGLLAQESWPLLEEALRTETDDTASMLALIPIVAAFQGSAGESLLPLTRHPDAEVLAEAAQALAELKVRAALPPLEAVVNGAFSDPRFSPKAGRPDPARTLAKIEAAVRVLRRVPATSRR